MSDMLPPSDPPDDLADGLTRIHAEAAGVLRLELIRPHDAVALTLGTLAGDPEAARRLRAIIECGQRVWRQRHRKPVICLCCDWRLRDTKGITFTLAFPAVDDPTIAVAAAICARCGATDTDTMLTHAAEAFKAIWPGLRPLEITHPAARA